MAQLNPQKRERLLATFREESEEHLAAIRESLRALNEVSGPEQASRVEEAFRAMHTLKGAARSVGWKEVEGVCQKSEGMLSRLKRGEASLSEQTVDNLRQSLEQLSALLGASPVADVSVPVIVEPVLQVALGQRSSGTLRVQTTALDALIYRSEELLTPKLAVGARRREAAGLLETVRECREPVSGELAVRLSALELRLRSLAANLARDERAMDGLVEALQTDLRRLRMVPAATIFDAFPPMVEDLGRVLNKQVEWSSQGAEIEIDRRVLEEVKDPLLHLIRNALDHGIEASAVRAAQGKPARARLSLTLQAREDGRVEIRLEDDGRGIDRAALREAALRSGLASAEELRGLSDDQTLDLMFRSGLTTSRVITDISGHGLGMAIVKERVEKLGGQLEVRSRAGEGTSVRMLLPVARATFHGLLVEAGGSRFLLPLNSVEHALRVRPGGAGSALMWDNRALAVASLAALLGLPAVNPEEARTALVVRAGEESAVVLIDQVLGEEEVLVKEFQHPLRRVPFVAAAGLLGNGSLALILRPSDLVRGARQKPRAAAPAPAPMVRKSLRVLVADDSITTRTMEKNLLEAAGYQVKVAADGMGAWTILKSEDIDVLVSDIDMPVMNGFELTGRVRSDARLAGLPVILVTALDSREDKERGVEVGANAYLIKSSFDQSNLLEIIRRLIGNG